MKIAEKVKQRVNEIYSKMLPIVNGEKAGCVDEDDLCFIESLWSHFFKKGEITDAYLEEALGKLSMDVLNKIDKNIAVGTRVNG